MNPGKVWWHSIVVLCPCWSNSQTECHSTGCWWMQPGLFNKNKVYPLRSFVLLGYRWCNDSRWSVQQQLSSFWAFFCSGHFQRALHFRGKSWRHFTKAQRLDGDSRRGAGIILLGLISMYEDDENLNSVLGLMFSLPGSTQKTDCVMLFHNFWTGRYWYQIPKFFVLKKWKKYFCLFNRSPLN